MASFVREEPALPAMIVTTMGGIPVNVVEYTADTPAVSHAVLPQHTWLGLCRQ